MNHVSVIGTEPMRVIPCPPRLRLCAHGSRSGSPSDMPGRRLLLNGELIEGLSQLETLLKDLTQELSRPVEGKKLRVDWRWL